MTSFKNISFPIILCALLFACSGNDSTRVGTLPEGWVARKDMPGQSQWTIGKACLDPSDSTKFIVSPDGDELVNTGTGGVDLMTQEKYGDVHVELEFMLPVNGNSGVYPMGEYEIQIWDSFSKAIIMENQWMGTIVATAEPTAHPEKGGGVWQQLNFDFRAPRFDTHGKKNQNARFDRVLLNGQVIHENIEVAKPTPVCLTGKEAAEGPLMFQGFVGPVAFRKIKIERLEPK